MALGGACDIAIRRVTDLKRKVTTLQKQVQSHEGVMSRLSPLLSVLETRNNSSRQTLDILCHYLDSSVTEFHRLKADMLSPNSHLTIHLGVSWVNGSSSNSFRIPVNAVASQLSEGKWTLMKTQRHLETIQTGPIKTIHPRRPQLSMSGSCTSSHFDF